MMYQLIHKGKATKMELHEYYTLDEALKLYALMEMSEDIQSGMMSDIKNKGRR